MTVNLGGRLIHWNSPQIMGIINLTPDSFYAGSRSSGQADEFRKKVHQMVSDGADILDLGAYSSRPGAADISIQEEMDRLLPALAWVAESYPDIPISVDTFRAEVARHAVAAGAKIINDISSGHLDESMLETVATLQVPYISMHMRGNPQTMLQHSTYEHIIQEILEYFSQKLENYKKIGINDVIIDIGIGFAKTVDQNFFLLKHLQQFKALGKPLLIGVSRKSMIYKTLGVTAAEALNGSTALHMHALCQGANLLRVHDVKEAKETVQLYRKLYP